MEKIEKGFTIFMIFIIIMLVGGFFAISYTGKRDSLECDGSSKMPKEIVAGMGLTKYGNDCFRIKNNSDVSIYVQIRVIRGRQAPHVFSCYINSMESVEIGPDTKEIYEIPYYSQWPYWKFQRRDVIELNSKSLGEFQWRMSYWSTKIVEKKYCPVQGEGYSKHLIKKENAEYWKRMADSTQVILEGYRKKFQETKRSKEYWPGKHDMYCIEAEFKEYRAREDACRNKK